LAFPFGEATYLNPPSSIRPTLPLASLTFRGRDLLRRRELEVPTDPWPEGTPQTRLIVIAKGVDRARVETSLAAFNRLATAA
jgi:hypothetical protein